MLVHVYLAPGFEEVEFVTVVDILRRAGLTTRSVALDARLSVPGAHEITMMADTAFADAEPAPDLIVLPGGGPGTQALRNCSELHDRLRAQISAGRRVAAVCAAPTVLAHAGLLQGKQACCYPGCEAVLEEGGALVSYDEVVSDGLITTSRGAGTSAAFALELTGLLLDHASASRIGKAMLYLQ